MISIAERLKVKGEAIKKSFDNFDFDLRCASPGIIESFDEETQTVTVQLAITERIKISGVESNEQVPILVDVPIVIPQIQGYSLTFPIQPGDECLVVFSDTCFDAWFQSGGIQNQMSLRRHDLSDGFAIIGVKSQPNVIPAYQTNAVQLRNNAGTNYFRLSATEIEMIFGEVILKLDSSGVTITAPKVDIFSTKINAYSDLEVTGTTDLDDTTTIEGREFLEHTHDDTEPGDGNSGGVN